MSNLDLVIAALGYFEL